MRLTAEDLPTLRRLEAFFAERKAALCFVGYVGNGLVARACRALIDGIEARGTVAWDENPTTGRKLGR